MTTYIWAISQLEHNVLDGGVVTAHWRVSADDGQYSASAYGAADFKPDPEAAGFIPFEDLTEPDVLAWVWGLIGKEDVEANLASQIEGQKNPVTVPGLPWA